MKLLLLLFFILSPLAAFAGVEQISETEFRDLAQELSAKVNLFKEGWEQDPQAEFYGGTTRDYLYWLKGQFVEVRNPTDAARTIAKLKALPIIDVREFIIGDSDVDVISKNANSLDADDFGVRKIDAQNTDILDPKTELGKNEILQGYIPAEKIRLAKDGFHSTDSLGAGLHEIYQGKLSVHFASAADFAKSKYAQEGINHPILLALRYIRVQAINYYRTHGKEFPDAAKLLAGMDKDSIRAVQAVIDDALRENALKPYLERKRFQSWLNGAIQKSFRSYSNPTAALELMKKFGVDRLADFYPGKIEPLNQYVFAKYRDKKAIDAALARHNVKESDFFSPVPQFFPDGKLYHGTDTEEAFRGILFQGILPSQDGNAGDGLYGVALANKKFSEDWAGDKKRLLEFKVKPDAKIVDITQGEGKRIWTNLKFKVGDESKFADLFGIDIVRYPYDTEAFVVKNASVLSQAQGVYRAIKPLGKLLSEAAHTKDVQKLLDMISVNSLSNKEEALLWNGSGVTEKIMRDYVYDPANQQKAKALESILKNPHWKERVPLPDDLLTRWIQTKAEDPRLRNFAWNLLMSEASPGPSRLALIDSLSLTENVKSAYGQKVIHYLNKHSAALPNSTSLALHLMKTGNYGDDQVFDYLTKAKLTEAQLAGVLKSFNETSDLLLRTTMAAMLLRNGREVDLIKGHLLGQFIQYDKQTFGPLTLKALSSEFSSDLKLRQDLVEVLKKIFDTISPPTLHALLPYYAKIPEAKEFLVSEMNSKFFSRLDRDRAFYALFSFSLSDHELAEMLKYVFAHYADAMKASDDFAKAFAQTKERKEITRVYLEEFFRTENYGRESNLRHLLNTYGDKNFIGEWLTENLENKITLSPELGNITDAKWRRTKKAFQFLPLESKDAELKMFDLLLSRNDKGGVNINDVLHVRAEDPEIAALLRQAILKDKIGVGGTAEYRKLSELLQRMPEFPLPERKKLWRWLEAAMKYGHDEAYARANLYPLFPREMAQFQGCGSAFAKLGEKP